MIQGINKKKLRLAQVKINFENDEQHYQDITWLVNQLDKYLKLEEAVEKYLGAVCTPPETSFRKKYFEPMFDALKRCGDD